jgi:hypothetical protein
MCKGAANQTWVQATLVTVVWSDRHPILPRFYKHVLADPYSQCEARNIELSKITLSMFYRNANSDGGRSNRSRSVSVE